MKEVLDFAVHAVNIIPTALLVFVMLYWVTVIIGVMDLDTIDVDIDVDADIDIDADVDIDADADHAQMSGGWFNSMLGFFNLGKVPLMVFITFLVLPMWFLSIVTNYYLGITSFVISTAILVPIFFVCLFIAKFLTTPFVKAFAKIDHETEDVSPVGKVCKVILHVDSITIGQVEINVDGTTLRINAKSGNGQILNKGDTALVIDYIEEKKIYLIEPYKSN